MCGSLVAQALLFQSPSYRLLFTYFPLQLTGSVIVETIALQVPFPSGQNSIDLWTSEYTPVVDTESTFLFLFDCITGQTRSWLHRL